MEMVERSATALGFEVLPKRWIVERTFASINRNRRLARDFERYAQIAAAFVRLVRIRIMLRRLTRSNPCRRIQTCLVAARRDQWNSDIKSRRPSSSSERPLDDQFVSPPFFRDVIFEG